MRHETLQIRADDGTVLSVEQWLPEGEPTAIIHVLHGMAEHAARYEGLARALTAHGWAVRADDHRGHGRTIGSAGAGASRGVRGHFADADGWERVVADQRALLDAEQAAFPGAPIMLLGHSLGSIIARDVAVRWGGEIAALVLSGAPGSAGLLGRAGLALARREAAKDPSAPSPLLTKLSIGGYNRAFRPNRTDSDWLSRDEAVVDAYEADPLCGFTCTSGFFRDMLTGLARVTSPRVLAGLPTGLPVLVTAGGADPVAADGRATLAIGATIQAAGVADVTCTVHPGARHEIFQETNREQIIADTIGWIASRLG